MNNEDREQLDQQRDALRQRRHYTATEFTMEGGYLKQVEADSEELFGASRPPAIRTETNAAASEASGGGVTHPPVSGSAESIQEAP